MTAFRTTLAATIFALAAMFVTAALSQDLLSPTGRPDRPQGSETAPVTLIEYSSPTCGHCVRYHIDVAPRIKADYVDSGKVRLIYRPLVRNTVDAAIFLLAASVPPDTYETVLDAYYTRLDDIMASANVAETLQAIAATVGIDSAAFDRVLADEAAAAPLQQLTRQAVNDFGVTSTPTFFLNGEKIVGGMSYEDMAGRIDAALPK